MKNYCVLCGNGLKDSIERYVRDGNFCQNCISQCSMLSNANPGENPRSTVTYDKVEQWQNSSDPKDIDMLHRYNRRVEFYEENKEAYERMVNRFQDYLLKINNKTI